MAKSLVRIMCWERSHITELAMNKAQEKKLDADIPKLKKVCPDCKPENRSIVIVNGTTVFNPSKAYRCQRGHLSLIAPLGDGLHIRYGPTSDEFVNVMGTLDELSNLIDNEDVACNHVMDDGPCDNKLTPLDDFKLSYPSSPAVKTRMCIGDLWDRHGIEPVRTGQYNGTGDYQESRSQIANKKRLASMQRDRNLPKDRHPGKPINKATKRDYGRRDKSSVNPDRPNELHSSKRPL